MGSAMGRAEQRAPIACSRTRWASLVCAAEETTVRTWRASAWSDPERPNSLDHRGSSRTVAGVRRPRRQTRKVSGPDCAETAERKSKRNARILAEQKRFHMFKITNIYLYFINSSNFR